MQLLCRFDILAITEMHLDKTVTDTALTINGMKFLRLDQKGRKGGGCILYYAEHLQATHRRDLFTKGLEAIWVQVKFPSNSVLFAVMYRPPDANNFFDILGLTLEKAWLKSSNIVLLGDFNCDFSNRDLNETAEFVTNTNARKLRLIFDMFNMQKRRKGVHENNNNLKYLN
jgi:exonuclease III